MTRDIAFKLSTAFEQLGWNHTLTCVGADRSLTLNVTEVSGDMLLQLFNILAPGGTPLVGINASLSSGGLVVS